MSNQKKMGELPQWLQDLWDLSPAIARKAEKSYLALFTEQDMVDFAIEVYRSTAEPPVEEYEPNIKELQDWLENRQTEN